MRRGGLELALYDDGVQRSRPIAVEYATDSGTWSFNLPSNVSGAEYLNVELSQPAERAGGWVLALARLQVNGNHFGLSPVLFRFADGADLLPTGVAYFEVPTYEGEYPNHRRTGAETWHLTIRGRGAS